MVNGKEKVSASLDIFSTILTSLVEVTVFITGCFQCSKNSDYYHKNDQDRAWFDDQRIQTEEPYCYVNPAATHTVKSNKYQSDQIINGKHPDSNGVDTLSSNKCRSTGKLEDSIQAIPLSVNILENNSLKNEKHKKDPYQSFAVNVQEEYLDSKKNSFRCEGDGPFKLKPIPEVPKRGKMRSPVAHRRIWHQLSADSNNIDWDNVSFDSSIEDDISLDEYKLFDDIWRSCELENAFVDYNMAALNGVAWNMVNQQNSAGRKSPNEKFDDIFPSRKYLEAKISENLDSLSSFDSESDFSLTKTSTCSNFSEVKSSNNPIQLDELYELIDLCICSNTKDNLELNISRHLRHFCDSDFNISGKTYGSNLLYDLVRQIMLENYMEYPSSSNLSRLIPLNNVKKKVLSVMKVPGTDGGETINKTSLNRISADTDKASDSIDRIINEEIISETRHWQNFDLESKAMRESIYKEIFSDLVDSTVTEVSLVWSTKLSAVKL